MIFGVRVKTHGDNSNAHRCQKSFYPDPKYQICEDNGDGFKSVPTMLKE